MLGVTSLDIVLTKYALGSSANISNSLLDVVITRYWNIGQGELILKARHAKGSMNAFPKRKT